MGALFAHESNFGQKQRSWRVMECEKAYKQMQVRMFFCGFGRCMKCEKLRWRWILVALRDGTKCENFGWTWTGRMKDWLGGWRGKLGLGLSRLVNKFFSHRLHWSECVNCNSLTKCTCTCLDHQSQIGCWRRVKALLVKTTNSLHTYLIYQLVNHHEKSSFSYSHNTLVFKLLTYLTINYWTTHLMTWPHLCFWL